MRFALCEESRRVRAVLVVRADDAGVAGRGVAVAGAVSRRRRLQSKRLEELRAGSMGGGAYRGSKSPGAGRYHEAFVHAKSLAPLFLLASYKNFRGRLLKVVSL